MAMRARSHGRGSGNVYAGNQLEKIRVTNITAEKSEAARLRHQYCVLSMAASIVKQEKARELRVKQHEIEKAKATTRKIEREIVSITCSGVGRIVIDRNQK